MAMEINTAYSSYAGSCTNSVSSKKQVTEETGNQSRKTAADELAYLSGKYSDYSFVAADYSIGMKYGSNSTTNVAISPQFLSKMANDPNLEAEYEGYIADMQRLDKEFAAQQAAMGWRVEQGWAIDKDGGISGWAIGYKDPNAKSYLQQTSENAQKIRERNDEKIKVQEELEKKRQSAKARKTEWEELMKEAGKAQFGSKFKDAAASVKDDDNMHPAIAVGVYLHARA